MVAIATTTLLAGLRVLLTPIMEERNLFVTFYLAVIINAWYGGALSALVSCAVSAIYVSGFYIIGRYQYHPGPDTAGLIMFVLVGIALALYSGKLLEARADAEAAVAESAERQRQLEVEAKQRRDAEQETLRLNSELEQRVKDRTAALEQATRELEGFTYTVAHDLRAPLRAISSSSRILLQDYSDELPAEASEQLERQARAATKLGTLIDDLLQLSRIGRQEMRKSTVDLSALGEEVAREVCEQGWPETPEIAIQPGMTAKCDALLMKLALENVFHNACKFAKANSGARIEFGKADDGSFFIRDEGVGFDMQYVAKLFLPFERLVTDREYPGTGIGLANVERVIERHGGRVWAEGEVGRGATIFFRL
jgi:light-regulated signal transduction histidine kinase (bacteriophytochrome)